MTTVIEGTNSPTELTRAEGLIFTGQLIHPEAPLYNMVNVFRLSGPVDVGAFTRAFDALVESTDALRSVFSQTDGPATVSTTEAVENPLTVLDFADMSDPEAAMDAWVAEDARLPFDVSQRCFRSALIRLGVEDYLWYLNQHHIITDAWSVAVIYRRLSDLYELESSGATVQDEEYPQFAAYRSYERTARETAHEASREVLELPPRVAMYGAQPPTGASTRTERLTFEPGPSRTARLRELAERDGELMAPLLEFKLVATALVALIARTSDSETISILAPVHNRSSRTLKETAGLFIEVGALSVDVGQDDTFAELLEKVDSATTKMFLATGPGSSTPATNRSRSILLNYIQTSLPPFAGLDMEQRWIHPGHGDAEHALRVQVHDLDASGSLTFHFDINLESFSEETPLIEHFEALFDAMLEDSTSSIGEVELLSPPEVQQKITSFNDTEEEFEFDSVVDAFAHQLETNPLATAVDDSGTTWSYAQLDTLSETYKAVIDQHGGNPTRVGVHLDRSVEAVAAILGALKAGTAYVPMPTDLPSERIRFMLADADVSFVFTTRSGSSSLPEEASALCIEELSPVEGEPSGRRVEHGNDSRVAYVLYTSGSTGEPKGVMISQDALANYVMWAADRYGDGRPVDFALHTSLGFDLTVTSILVPLVTGGKVKVYGDRNDGDFPIVDVFKDDDVDVVKLTPSHLAVVDRKLLATRRIKKLVLGGEDLKTSLARSVQDAAGPDMRIFNEYGPTEATVACMLHRFDPEVDVANSVPIGTPAANSSVYVLGPDLRPSPEGVVGEICIGGRGLAHGYLNRNQLTTQRFVTPAWLDDQVYRTGDLARWNNGAIEFLGRSDDQVKIRGHRIELGEIESVLESHANVARAVATVIETESVSLRSARSDLCIRCGLSTLAPGGAQDEFGVCETCHFYDAHKADAQSYFGQLEDLKRQIVERKSSNSEYDCMMLLSGGKDSTYALYQLAEMGLNVLVFTMDNGFISEGAKDNMRRVCSDLGFDLEIATTPVMNEIFVDSLSTFANVCQGCFKTIFTLSQNLAAEKGIPAIVTGLSRGQIFETRLADLFRMGITDPDNVDSAIVEARKAYHRAGDVASMCLPNKLFETDDVFSDIKILDFYRYCDVPLDQVLTYLGTHAPWVRPADTGRSTNCLINAAGIFVHTNERGFHNYAEAYAWDVRLGHKRRDEALAELRDDLDIHEIEDMLAEVGYAMKTESQQPSAVNKRLAAHYVPTDEATPEELRNFLGKHLPDYMIPAFFVPVSHIPLTRNGKVDHAALPDPRPERSASSIEFRAPRNETERILISVWESVLDVEGIGIDDGFFQLGGDSILATQIVAAARQRGLEIKTVDVIRLGSIAEVASKAGEITPTQLPDTPQIDPGISEDDLETILSRYTD